MNFQTGETFEHRQLFDYYYLLEPDKRTYKAVAEHYAGKKIGGLVVTEARVKRWAGQFKWADMARYRDEEVSRKVEEQITGTLADAKAELLTKNATLIWTWFKEKMGSVEKAQETIERIPARDILGFMKFQADLLAESPTGNEQDKNKPANNAIQQLTTDELRRLAKSDKPSRPN